MNLLVEQIVQRLELLPERALQQVLDIVKWLEVSASSNSVKVVSQERQELDLEGTINLKKVGDLWIVKASSVPVDIDWDNCLLQAREERMDKFTQW